MKESFRFGEFTTDVQYLSKAELPAELLKAGLVVFDENTAGFVQALSAGNVVLPPGETSKSWDSVELILNEAVRAGLSRKDFLAGVGGGVVCDMTAFAASIYMRGAGLVLVPTTLLAMVDASLGGKTGINFAGYKNMAGTFYPAGKLLVVPEFLESLPEREFRSGLAEVIKTAALGDRELFEMLETSRAEIFRRDIGLLSGIVRRCIRVKGKIVEADLREKNVRAWLNLGHTFGHALESVTNFSAFSHGEAVAWGMGRALALGTALGITDRAYAARLRQLLESYGFDLSLNASPQALLGAMAQDKKKVKDGIVFVLQENLCENLTRTVERETILAVLAGDA